MASEICCVEDVRLRGILLEKFIEVAKVRLYCCFVCSYYALVNTELIIIVLPLVAEHPSREQSIQI